MKETADADATKKGVIVNMVHVARKVRQALKVRKDALAREALKVKEANAVSVVKWVKEVMTADMESTDVLLRFVNFANK